MSEGRTPLVYSTPRARRQAERLIPGRVVENLVQSAIAAGRVSAGQTGGLIFDASRRWVAVCERVPARIQANRRAWLITEVRPY